MWSLNKVSLRNQSLFEVSLSMNSHQISFQAMWSHFKPITLLHYFGKSENIRDFIKKYFHLNTIAVYNSSAKKSSICWLQSSCLMTPSYHAYWHLNRKLLIDTLNFFFFFFVIGSYKFCGILPPRHPVCC